MVQEFSLVCPTTFSKNPYGGLERLFAIVRKARERKAEVI
jgi:hypothetical protein